MSPIAQKSAQDAIAAYVEPTNPVSAASAVVQPGTGQVFAVATAEFFGEDTAAGQSTVNYAVDMQYGQSAGFQAGSTFKIFTLTAAMEAGVSLYDRFIGSARTRSPTSSDCDARRPASSRRTTVEELHRQLPSGHADGSDREVDQHRVRRPRGTDHAVRGRRHGRRGWASRRSDGDPLQQVPAFTLGTRRGLAAVDGRGRSRRWPRVACTASRTRSPRCSDRDGNVLLAPAARLRTGGRPQVGRRRLVRPAGRDDRAAGPAPSRRPRPARRGQDRHDERQHRGLVRRLHPEPRHRGLGRQPRQLEVPAVERDDQRRLLRQRLRLPHPRTDLAADHAEHAERHGDPGRGVRRPAAGVAAGSPGRGARRARPVGRGGHRASSRSAGFSVAVSPGREFSDYPKDTVARTSPPAART